MGWIDIKEECFVTFFADERYSQIFDRRGEVMGYRLEGGTKLIHDEGISLCFTKNGNVQCNNFQMFLFCEVLVNNFFFMLRHDEAVKWKFSGNSTELTTLKLRMQKTTFHKSFNLTNSIVIYNITRSVENYWVGKYVHVGTAQ